MFELVIAIVGDSPTPINALLNSELANRYLFFYTEEHDRYARQIEAYCNENLPSKTIDLQAMPSISDSSAVVHFAKEKMAIIEDAFNSVAILLTAGAKQTIMPFVIHSTSTPFLTLLHSPLRLIVHNPNQPTIECEVSITMEQSLGIRGWKLEPNGDLVNDSDEVINDVNTEFSSYGVLKFSAQSTIMKQGGEWRKPGEKNKLKKLDQAILDKLLTLSQSFGRNGAQYVIQGALRNPTTSVLPYFVSHELPEDNQEEE